MKQTIRLGTFETNSSSTHSLVMCSAEDYQKWYDGEFLINPYSEEFVKKQEIIEKTLKEHKKEEILEYWYDFDEEEYNDADEERKERIFQEALYNYLREYYEIFPYEDYWDKYEEYYETFEQHYTTKNGDEVVAFGYYGYDG